ncbi:MAG: Clp protease N-terminal domain-containing protein [Candidatus Melainabacteria bacterium]|nr:Clp protease N-terminal domain-containing protein [Candidatus Melainabacteria bacterium]
MSRKYTARAAKVIELAGDEARRQGFNLVGTEQLLLGLIGEGTGIAACTLLSSGVCLENARDEIARIIGRGAGVISAESPLSTRAKRVLELASNECSRLEHGIIDTEHLLLGLVREGEGVGYCVLQNLGIDPLKLRIHILVLCFERHKEAAAANPKDMVSLGCAGRALYILERYGEAKEYFSAAMKLPGGEHYLVAVDACKQHLKGRGVN